MGEPMKKTSCQIACWAMGAGAGFVAFIMLMVLGDWSFIQAVFGASVVTLVLGALLSWILCKPLPALGQVQAGMTEVAATHTAKAETASAPAAPAAAPAAASAATAPAAAMPAAAPAAVEVKSGTLLQGESELAARKGSWTYQAQTEPAPKAKPAPKPKAEAKPKAETKAKAAPKAKVKAADAPAATAAEAKPATLKAARGGKADNLKEIKGVGPKLEAMLHGMGFYHFDQIAAWTAAELAWVDTNLEGFKGRATRDNWVEQAKILASGGETEFSRRVEDGDVY